MSCLAYVLSLMIILFPFNVKGIKNVAIGLGDELISCVIENKDISSKYAIFVGEKLQLVLQENDEEFKMGYEIEFHKGDLKFPYGDGKAHYRIIIISSKGEELLTLRLKYDKKQAKFHILGFLSSTTN